MEELVTLDCLFIDGTKVEANAKYSFVWKKVTGQVFRQTSKNRYGSIFQEETTPYHQAIKLDEE